MRNNLVKEPVKFEDFFVPYTTTLSLNWPYPDDQVLIRSLGPNEPRDVKLNPVFETHLRNIDNWSLGTAFKQAHPHLIGEGMRIEDQPR
nr:hypothetical protein CFP56_00529 [Quercus suber]